ncbi:DUF6760 family protein [Lentzea sp. NPDC005914]|uniref:DUF6760 family protein n=1 Tax=Lentzea sp. NPDC005914 TaxID=3154572 RepID=UPI0034000CE5
MPAGLLPDHQLRRPRNPRDRGTGYPFSSGGRRGGLGRYAADELWREIAYLAYHLHWGMADLLDLEHGDRVRLLEEVGVLNERFMRGFDSDD